MHLATTVVGLLAAAATVYGAIFLAFLAGGLTDVRLAGYLAAVGPAGAVLGALAVWAWPRLAAALFGVSAAAWIGFATTVFIRAGSNHDKPMREGIVALLIMVAPAVMPLLGTYLAHRSAKK